MFYRIIKWPETHDTLKVRWDVFLIFLEANHMKTLIKIVVQVNRHSF